MDSKGTRVENLRTLAEQIVHARPSTEDDARAALEWIASREGKTLEEVVAEIRTSVGASLEPQPPTGPG